MKVPNPNADEYANGRTTVYDTYKFVFPNSDKSAPEYKIKFSREFSYNSMILL